MLPTKSKRKHWYQVMVHRGEQITTRVVEAWDADEAIESVMRGMASWSSSFVSVSEVRGR